MSSDHSDTHAPAVQDGEILDPTLIANVELSEEQEPSEEQHEQHSVLQTNIWHNKSIAG